MRTVQEDWEDQKAHKNTTFTVNALGQRGGGAKPIPVHINTLFKS